MEIENSLKKLNKWYGTVLILCIIFAIITFFLWVGTRNWIDFTDHAQAVGRFWASLALTVALGVLSATIKKIHKVFVVIAGRN